MLSFARSPGGLKLAKRKRRTERAGSKADPPTSSFENTGPASSWKPPRGLAIATLMAFLGLSFVVYSPSLEGEFISDDAHYVQNNAYVQDPTGANLVAILDPTSVVPRLVENYAPVHLLLHAAEWQLFGESVRGYHVVNIVVHALAAGLLVLLFVRSGISPVAALLAGLFFLVHPGNVEAVAWISQLKTTASMVLCIGALLAHPRRPGWAVVLFGLALLAKPTALVALPVVMALGWVRTRPEDGPAPTWRWGWVGLWFVVLGGFAVAEWMAFSNIVVYSGVYSGVIVVYSGIYSGI